MSSTVVILFAVYLAYAVLGGVALRLWLRHKAQPRPATLGTAPGAWLAYWLPRHLAVQLWAFIGGGLVIFALYRSSSLLNGVDDATFKIGFVIGIGVPAICFAASDVVMVVRARQVKRRQQAAAQANGDGASSH